jgi:peptide/nickel transport system substrate-binding protein
VASPLGRVRALVLVACALAFSGCTKVSTADTASGGHSWTHHGRLIYAESQDAKTLNPMLSTSLPVIDLSYFVFSYAVRYDDKARPVPDTLREIPTLANGDVSQDGLTLRYKLRPNIYFHDGVQLTCRDLAFTWRAVMNPANNDITQDGYRDIQSIDCSDPLVAVVHMKRVYAPFLQQLWGVNGNAPILPEHVLAKYNDAKGSFNTAPFQSLPIGSGPFSVVRWDRGQQVVMKAFDRYFLGRPKLSEVVFKYIPDENTMIDQVRTHEIDMGVHITLSEWPLVQGIPGTVALAPPVYTFDHVDFNLRRPIFADVNVRRALSMALNRVLISKDVAHGLSDQTDTALSPRISWAWTKDTAHYDYDAVQAARLLDAAGWKMGSDGIRERAGQRFAFNLSTQTESATGKANETIVQSEWHAIGADVTIKNDSTAQFFDNTTIGTLQGGHYDAAIFAWGGAADPDDSSIYAAWNFPPRGQNALFWGDPVVSRAMKDELSTVDRARRLRDFQIEQKQFASDVPSIILGYRREPEVYNSDLHGFTASPVDSPFWNPQEYSI